MKPRNTQNDGEFWTGMRVLVFYFRVVRVVRGLSHCWVFRRYQLLPLAIKGWSMGSLPELSRTFEPSD